MIDARVFLAQPIKFKNICKIYPPIIKQILNEENYLVYHKLFLNSQEDLEDEWAEQQKPLEQVPTPFEYLLMMADLDPRIKKIIIEGFNFFIHEPVMILGEAKMVFIGDIKEVKTLTDLRVLKEDDYFEFQNTLRRAIGEKEIEPYNPNENPRIKYFKAKARLRDRVKSKSSNGLSLGTTLASICCMGIGITPLNIGELSQAAISVLMRIYQEKFKYEMDIEALMNGADSKKVKPQYWIRNIEDL